MVIIQRQRYIFCSSSGVGPRTTATTRLFGIRLTANTAAAAATLLLAATTILCGIHPADAMDPVGGRLLQEITTAVTTTANTNTNAYTGRLGDISWGDSSVGAFGDTIPVTGDLSLLLTTQESQEAENVVAPVSIPPPVPLSLQVSLDISLWIPSTDNTDGSSIDMTRIEQGVLEALLELLCTEIDVTVKDASTTQNVCALHNYDRRQRQLLPTIGSSSVIQGNPMASIRPLQRLDLSSPRSEYYAVWTVQYTAVTVGELYVQMAMQKNATLFFLDNQDAQLLEPAVQIMQQTIQLALDLSVMERDFDRLLRKHVTATAATVYSSPVGREATIFAKRQEDMTVAQKSGRDTSRYQQHAWNPMLISGLALLWTTVSVTATLCWLASQRRMRLVDEEQQAGETTTTQDATAYLLQSPEGVDSLLKKSAASFRIPTSLVGMDRTGSMLLVTNDAEIILEDDEYETRIPLPLALQNF